VDGVTPPTWQELAALGLAEALDGCTVDIDGAEWDADAEDSDGDTLPPGQLYLTSHEGGRQVLIVVTVELVEGTPT
jgi:hypothetical protein